MYDIMILAAWCRRIFPDSKDYDQSKAIKIFMRHQAIISNHVITETINEAMIGETLTALQIRIRNLLRLSGLIAKS